MIAFPLKLLLSDQARRGLWLTADAACFQSELETSLLDTLPDKFYSNHSDLPF